MTTAELLACQCHRWYPAFRQLCYSTEFISLPPAFVSYLQEDGVFLPDDTDAMPVWSGTQEASPGSSFDGSEDSEVEDGPAEVDWRLRFPVVAQQIAEAIARLGGTVIPKLNWSCPSDASWLSTDGLKCFSAAQVMLLLKSSDRVSHDLELLHGPAASGAVGPQPATLALRKWRELRPEREFRCFVRGQQLVGVCQRDPTQTFPQLPQELPSIRSHVEQFHVQHVAGRFPLQAYTYDIYVTSQGNVRLIDFNPVGGTTQPLLFTWEELGIVPGGSGGETHASTADQVAADQAATDQVAVHQAAVDQLRLLPAANGSACLCSSCQGIGTGTALPLSSSCSGCSASGSSQQAAIGLSVSSNAAAPLSSTQPQAVSCAQPQAVSSIQPQAVSCAQPQATSSAQPQAAPANGGPHPANGAEGSGRKRGSQQPGSNHEVDGSCCTGAAEPPALPAACSGAGSIGKAADSCTGECLPSAAARAAAVSAGGPAQATAAVARPLWRIAQSALSVLPGQRAACSMPYDMLMLQETVAGMVGRMRSQSP